MPLVSSSIANLVNGVSQQPYTLRLSSQSEVQENGLSTVARGLRKRPPTKHVKRISASIASAYVHTINRDENERYTVVISNYDLRVFDQLGNERTVNFPNGKSSLASMNPVEDFRAVTVADYTFVLNRSIVVHQGGQKSPARPFEALIVVKTGLYGKTYSVKIGTGTAATYTTPNGSVATDTPQIATDAIANGLATSLTSIYGSTGLTVTRYGSVIYLTKSTDFTVSTSDGYSDTAMYAVKGKLQRFSDLPPNAAVQDFTVEIVGDKTSSFDNYWVRFDMSGGSGVWRETVEPDTWINFSPADMPMALVRESNGTFTYKEMGWKVKQVGDDSSNPHPSFVGKTIKDVFFYRNRLGFLSDESVCLSEAGEYFNFYLTTVTDLLDSDPIDVSVSHTKVSNLWSAVPFAKQLLLFSPQTQFSVESGDLLTPKTISIKPTTEFECIPTVRPESIGKVVFFAVPRGDYSGVREYFVDQNTNTNDAADITSHIPEYIPSGITKMAVALNEDILCAITPKEPNAIFVYKFYWNNNEKLQSSWSKWVFPETDQIVSIDFLASTLNMVVNRPDGLYLETLDVSTATLLGNEPYEVHLDRKQYIYSPYLGFDGTYTTISDAFLGYRPTTGDYLVVVAGPTGINHGEVVPVIWDGTKAKLKGDYTGNDVVIGRKYALRYKFSTIVPKSRTQTGGEKADSVARLQLRNMQINYSNTGFFQAKVTPLGRDTYTYTFSGKKLGLQSSTIGAINLETGSFRFPVMSQNITADIELYSDSPLPCSFLSADWEGYYAKRSQGI